jgi:hypothetical protein
MSSWVKEKAAVAESLLRKTGDPSDPVAWIKRNQRPIWESVCALAQERRLPYSRRAGDELLQETAAGIFELALWARDGFNVFRLSEGLCSALVATSVSKQFEQQRLPYGAVILDLSETRQRWAVVGGVLSQHAIVCNYLSESRSFWRVRIFGTDQSVGGDTVWAFRHAENLFGAQPPLEGTVFSRVCDGEDAAIETLTRLAASLTVWWNSSAREAERTGLSRRVARKQKERSRPTHWMLGKSVRVHPGLAQAARGRASDVRELEAQHVVRGHFKQQAHGAGLAQRKTLWIEPYWRGPDTETAWTHVYAGRGP